MGWGPSGSSTSPQSPGKTIILFLSLSLYISQSLNLSISISLSLASHSLAEDILLEWHVCRTKLDAKCFYRGTNLLTKKMLRNFPRIFEPLFCVFAVRQNSRQTSLPKIEKKIYFTDELLQERRENILGRNSRTPRHVRKVCAKRLCSSSGNCAMPVTPCVCERGGGGCPCGRTMGGRFLACLAVV